MYISNRKKNIIRNSVTGVFRLLSTIVFPFLIRTLMIWKLGQEYVGLNGIFNSIFQMLNIMEMGFGTAVIYFLYKPIAENDKEKIGNLIYFISKFYNSVGIVVGIIGIAIIPYLKYFVNNNDTIGISIYLLYCVLLFGCVSAYFANPHYATYMAAAQRSDLENNAFVFSSFIVYACEIFVLLVYSNFILYCIVGALQNTILACFRYCFYKKNFPSYNFSKKLDKSEIKNIFYKMLALVGHRINTPFVNSIDTLVVSNVFGVVSVAIFSNYYYIVVSVNSIVSVLFASIQASVGDLLISLNKSDEEYNVFIVLQYINSFIVGLFGAIMLCFYQNFMYVWVGENFMVSQCTVIMFVILFYVISNRSAVTVFKNSKGMWEQDKYKPYVSMCLNILGDIVLVRYFGIEGIIASSIVCIGLVETIWELIVVCRHCFADKKKVVFGHVILLDIINCIVFLISFRIKSIFAISCNFLINSALLSIIIPSIVCFSIYLLLPETKKVIKTILG